MKITTENYFDTVKKFDLKELPEVLFLSHEFIVKGTDNGKDWSAFGTDAGFTRMTKLVFQKLEEFMNSKKENLSGTTQEEKMDGTKGNENKPKKVNPYSKIGMEIKFIHRFLAFHDKILYKNTFEIFIDELQKAIQKKEITKKSPVAKDIISMQNAVINAFNTMKNAKHFVLKPETIKRYKTIIEKYENAYEDLDDEPTEKKPKRKSIGLNGIAQSNGKIMSSLDFANLEFSTIGLKDKWLKFIGDPAPGFTAMVYGRPKMGKSYLCVDFAGYLARNHGKVLYVAKEEKLDATLQKKLKDKDVANENLFVTDNLPKNLSEYQFVFLDSVNKIGLSPQELTKLKTDNPGVSFIYIFQSTKEGKFRGTNEFQHDVDIVIEVPEQGKAIQYGRFNQGSEMNIFEEPEGELSGIKSEVMEIEAEFPVPLGEIFIYIKRKGEKEEDIVDILEKEPERGNSEMKKIANSIIRKKNLKIKILEVEHSYNDSSNIIHGVAYFTIKLSGEKKDLKKIAGNDKEMDYDWDAPHDGTKKNKTPKDWTEPKWLNEADWRDLKIIKNYYDKKDYKSAMNHAMNCDTVIREEIPPDVWKKMGGQLTKTGEEKLKAMQKKSSPKIAEPIKKSTIVFNHGVRVLKGVIEREWDLELTDGDYIEILDIAQERNSNLPEIVNAIHNNISEFLTIMKKALEEWDKKTGKSVEKSREKFYPEFYANRKDDENPRYIFSLTNTKVLTEALQGDFDLVYLVRRELTNRGLDSKGKWVGFDEARKIHRVD